MMNKTDSSSMLDAYPLTEDYEEEFSIAFTAVIERSHHFAAEASDRSFKVPSNLGSPYATPFSPTHASTLPKRGVAGRPFLNDDSRLFHTGHPFLIPVFPLLHRAPEIRPTALFCIALEAAKLLSLRDSSTLFSRHATTLTREWATESERLWLYDHDILSGANRYRPIAIVQMQELFPIYGVALLNGGSEKIEEAKALVAKGMRLTEAEVHRMKEKKYIGKAFQYEESVLQEDIQSTLSRATKEPELEPYTRPLLLRQVEPVKGSLCRALPPHEAEEGTEEEETGDGEGGEENEPTEDRNHMDEEDESSLEEQIDEEEEADRSHSDIESNSHPDKENITLNAATTADQSSIEKAATLQPTDPVSLSRMLLGEAFKAYNAHLMQLRKNRLAEHTDLCPKRNYYSFKRASSTEPSKASLFPVALLPGQYQDKCAY